MRNADRPLLVVGCGSEVARDDAAGSELVQLLAELHPRGDTGFALLPIVFVDAIASGREAGTIVVTPLPKRETLAITPWEAYADA